MARAAAACCLATVFLLFAVAVFVSGASDPLTAMQATESAGVEGTSNLLPVHCDGGNEEEEAMAGKRRGDAAGEMASLASAEVEGKKVESNWGSRAKKLDDDNDDGYGDLGPFFLQKKQKNSDHDHVYDHDSGSDHDHDSDHDSDSDHDHDSGHDSDLDHDHDQDSDSDQESDSDSDSNSDDDDNNNNSKHGRKKKHPAPGRKGAPGGKHDDDLPKSVIKV